MAENQHIKVGKQCTRFEGVILWEEYFITLQLEWMLGNYLLWKMKYSSAGWRWKRRAAKSPLQSAVLAVSLSHNLRVEWWTNFTVITLSLALQQALQSLHSDRTNANSSSISCSLEFSYTASESKSAQLQHSELNAVQTLKIPFTWIPDTNSCNGLHSAPLTDFKSLLPPPRLGAKKILELPYCQYPQPHQSSVFTELPSIFSSWTFNLFFNFRIRGSSCKCQSLNQQRSSALSVERREKSVCGIQTWNLWWLNTHKKIV